MYYLLVRKYKPGLFENYYNEYNSNKKVLIHTLKNNETIKNNKITILIAFYNLPDGKNRLFLRAKQIIIEDKNIYARSLRGISDLYNNDYSLDEVNLKENYFGEIPKKWESIKKLDKLDENNIESPFDNKNEYYRIKNLQYYFYDNANCLSCNKKSNVDFITTSGMKFVEFHHFIPRYLLNNIKYNSLSNIINSPKNLIKLCPICHSKIHYAEFTTRMNTIKIIYSQIDYELKKEIEAFYTKHEKEIKKESAIIINNVNDWLLSLYLNKRESKLYNAINK